MGKKQDEFYSSADMALEYLKVVEKNAEAYVDTIIRQKTEAIAALNRTIEKYNKAKLDFTKQVQKLLLEDRKLSNKVVETYKECEKVCKLLDQRLKEWEDGEER